MTQDNLAMDVTAGIDIGNGYVKAKLAIDGGAPKFIDMPSCVTWWNGIQFVPATATDDLMADFTNELDCRMRSTAIKASDEHRLLIGRRAVASGGTPVIFDINDRTPKCDDSLSYQLIFSTLAGAALSEYWDRTHALPTSPLRLDVYAAVALPITDYTAYRERYRQMLMASEAAHVVHIQNFDREITVEIHFMNVEVLAEGAAAQYAIADMGAEFMDVALAAARADGMVIDEEETGETILSYDNTIGIDIGEGTVNFPVFRDGRVSVESSSSINKGYGTVLDEVVKAMRNLPYAPQSRKDLAEFMIKPNPNPRDRRLREKLQVAIDDAIESFVHDVVSEYNRVKRNVLYNLDVVYVYGGGANAVRGALYPALIEASRLDADVYTPVVWLDSVYSRDLNRNGMYLVASMARSQRGFGA